jgi:hypothetical protein
VNVGSSSVDVRIEELVLHGTDPNDRLSIGHAVRDELGRLLLDGGAPSRLRESRSIDRLDGGTFDVPASASPRVIGARIAAAVLRGMS